MTKVLITGGAGYIGSVLTELLLEKGYKVTVLDNLSLRQLSLLHISYHENFNLVDGDATDEKLVNNLLPAHDVIIPLAAVVGAPACEINKDLATKLNFEQIKNIVNNLSVDQRLLMPNTNSQYGSSEEIITEESLFNPLSHYARTKCDAENYIRENGNGVCFRLATVFGASPRMRTDLLVNDFVLKALVDGYLVLFQSHFKRNYIHVKDIANTFLFGIENYEKMNSNVFNVGLSSANLSKLELAQKIKQYLTNLVIVENDFTSDFDNRNYIVSNEKLENLGWQPQYDLDKGIKELLKAYKMIVKHSNKNFTNL
tara:strand:+ start:863 stop:1801 length:939 start_codon:yes stop_codon:yes gene_type:complete